MWADPAALLPGDALCSCPCRSSASPKLALGIKKGPRLVLFLAGQAGVAADRLGPAVDPGADHRLAGGASGRCGAGLPRNLADQRRVSSNLSAASLVVVSVVLLIALWCGLYLCPGAASASCWCPAIVAEETASALARAWALGAAAISGASFVILLAMLVPHPGHRVGR